MKYQLEIRDKNVEPHLDIEGEIKKKKDGLFTCIIRCNAGNIVDIVFNEYVTAKDFLRLKSITFEEHTITHSVRKPSPTDGIRPDNSNGTASQRTGTDTNAQFSKAEA